MKNVSPLTVSTACYSHYHLQNDLFSPAPPTLPHLAGDADVKPFLVDSDPFSGSDSQVVDSLYIVLVTLCSALLQ